MHTNRRIRMHTNRCIRIDYEGLISGQHDLTFLVVISLVVVPLLVTHLVTIGGTLQQRGGVVP